MSDAELLRLLELKAIEQSDGHLTIMRFTTNWRVCFRTPTSHDDIANSWVGPTFAAAATQALLAGHTQAHP